MKNLRTHNNHISIDLFSACMVVCVDGANIRYAEKYVSLQQTIKDRYAAFEVEYYGKDNDDYLIEQGYNNAISFDGSTSATLVQDKSILVNPSGTKDKTIPTGIRIMEQPQ
ncbi:hypothetical protein FACS189429_1840 [Bacteroidia bacterium]|nr:hypothetical protein FACS189429_1840 [Bacteroidia bacterium]GHV44109.1 hypothetical protein FACS1894180_5020 [Bacteroidia bacterium]